MKILIVDDGALNRTLLKALLRAEGCETAEAEDGVRALEQLETGGPFDCVVTDILMPEMDGYRLCQEIRARPALKELPVIVYTATYVSPGDKKLALEMGADLYLRKPAPAAEMMKAIAGITTARRAPKAAASSEVVLKQYNEALIKKLEERGQQLHVEAAKLAASEDLFRQLADAIQEVFWLAEPDLTRVLYVSPAYESIWGRSAPALLENAGEWRDSIHPEDRERAVGEILALARNGEAFSVDFRIVRPDGQTRWIASRAFPIKEGGVVRRIAGTATDVTEQRRLRDQFLQAQKMEAVGRLAGGVAHDFNNLLTVILGLSEVVLLDLPEQAPARADLSEILATGRRAAQLTQQLLAFSRRQVFEPRPSDLNEIVRGAERLLRRLIGEDVSFESRLAEGLPPALVDPAQIEQVLVNLCVNARDAMPAGGRITVATGPGPDGRVALSVSDTGSGLSPEALAHLFEPFFTTKPVGKGTGLGLATCYGIVRQSGGDIAAESSPGAGATFRISLPAAGEPARAPAAPAAQGARGGAETVLVIEDDDSVRRLTCRILRDAGYTVLEAGDGAGGLDALRADAARAVRLVITDVIMPVMDGRKLAEGVRAWRPGLPVLFMSGYSDESLSHSGVLDEGVLLLRKPYTAAQLKAKVREVLDQGEAA